MAFALTGAPHLRRRAISATASSGDHRPRPHRAPSCRKATSRPACAVRRVEGLLAPGFIDVQVNGGGGVLFNDEPTVEGIAAIAAAHRRYGTTGLLPTLITDTRERMARGHRRRPRRRSTDGVPGVLGIHLEGPFLNPERKGVHDPALMRRIDEDDIALVTSLGAGRTLITLAPGADPPEIIAPARRGRA